MDRLNLKEKIANLYKKYNPTDEDLKELSELLDEFEVELFTAGQNNIKEVYND